MRQAHCGDKKACEKLRLWAFYRNPFYGLRRRKVSRMSDGAFNAATLMTKMINFVSSHREVLFILIGGAIFLIFVILNKNKHKLYKSATISSSTDLEARSAPLAQLSDFPQNAGVKRQRTGAALDRSNKEREALVGDRAGLPPTEPMIAAVRRLGYDPSAMDFQRASTLLSIRDYVYCLAQRTPEQETSRQLRALIEELLSDTAVHADIRNWSWHTRNHDVRRIPKNALRWRCEQFLKQYRS